MLPNIEVFHNNNLRNYLGAAQKVIPRSSPFYAERESRDDLRKPEIFDEQRDLLGSLGRIAIHADEAFAFEMQNNFLSSFLR
jgi:hypothetical protein